MKRFEGERKIRTFQQLNTRTRSKPADPLRKKKAIYSFEKEKKAKKQKTKQQQQQQQKKTKLQQQQVIMPESIFINTPIQIRFFSSFPSIFLLSYVAYIFLFNTLFFFC